MLSNRMKQETSDIIFIQETKCSIQKLRQIHSKWISEFEFLEVNAENTAGGILTLWNPHKIGILDAEASKNYLSVVIQPVGERDTFFVTNVYGPQRIDDKLRFLDSLVDLKDRHADIPWIMGGDFNMIKSLSEKKGGTRALNKEVTAQVLPFGGSDHWLIQLEIKGIGTPRNKPFRFENIWLSHPNFISNIEKWWSEDLQIGTIMYLLHKRLKHIKLWLKEWNNKDFGNIF
eukprot:PITA_03205